jgi:predicted nucleic acid-binding protein
VIVADTNLLAYLVLGGAEQPLATGVARRDAAWAVPQLWRSEFRNILAGYMRLGRLGLAGAWAAHEVADRLVAGREYAVRGHDVLRLVESSRCSAYDCEFAALAQHLAVPLVTWDKQLLRGFPGVAVAPKAFVS